MYKTSLLLQKIEQLRDDMQVMARKQGYTSPESLALSKKLDHLLNIYSGCVKLNDKYSEDSPTSDWQGVF